MEIRRSTITKICHYLKFDIIRYWIYESGPTNIFGRIHFVSIVTFDRLKNCHILIGIYIVRNSSHIIIFYHRDEFLKFSLHIKRFTLFVCIIFLFQEFILFLIAHF